VSFILANVRAVIAEASRPGRFFVRADLTLAWRPPALEEISWEIFRGRLLDPAHTRQSRCFIAWNIYQIEASAPAAEPLISVKLDEETGALHVVRALLCHVWEGFDSGSNVIQSREITKWVRELVGTIDLEPFAGPGQLQEELIGLLRAAVRGTSRLPLNSVEAPLPAYSLGQLDYLPFSAASPSDRPARTWQELSKVLPHSLESLLRCITPDVAVAVARHVADLPIPTLRSDMLCWLRSLFTDVSLSPYTDFVATTLAFVRELMNVGTLSAADEIDLWSWLLRQLGRHLTAYDLTTFHYRGANYPDALLLDAVLKRYVQLIEEHPALFHGGETPAETHGRRVRRRALRQSCLLRRFYEGHAVPDQPTSPGENARVLPSPHVRVPEEQLLNVSRRRKRLFEGQPLSALLSSEPRRVLHASLLDLAEPHLAEPHLAEPHLAEPHLAEPHLAEPREWRELGTGVFIDRPLGWGKAVGEPDLTPLLAHEAYSASIARRRCGELERLADELDLESVDWSQPRRNEFLDVPGLPAVRVAEPDRPVVSLADARRVADDFVIIRTLRGGLEEVFTAFDFTSMGSEASLPDPRETLLLVRLAADEKGSVLALFDHKMRQRLEMVTDLSRGFSRRGGRELPAAGLTITRVCGQTDTICSRTVRTRCST
jgi:hypothetical protein